MRKPTCNTSIIARPGTASPTPASPLSTSRISNITNRPTAAPGKPCATCSTRRSDPTTRRFLETRMHTKDIAYQGGGKTLNGYLADGSNGKKTAGILICHQGGGLRDHEKDRARMLAELGYVAFACDMYGAVAQTMEQAGPLMFELSTNPALWQARVQAGIDTLKAQANVDAARLAAIGFCFGGGTMIQMCRWATEMKWLVGFHPGMQGLPEKDERTVVTKLMLCAGQQDPLLPPAARERFLKLMADANADAQLITYARAGHSFTDKTVAQFNMPNFEYHADTDRRSWAAMRDQYAEPLGKVA